MPVKPLDKFAVAIAGAGVVGLAVALELARSGRYPAGSIVLLEKEAGFGQHSSSRNSEVIHAGIYYAQGSLKAQLCVRGKHLLYEHCGRYGVNHRRCGKYIVAQAGEEEGLEALRRNALDNGVDDLDLISSAKLAKSEPAVSAAGALFSPSTGIIDSHEYMQSLLHLAQQAGVLFAPFTEVCAVEQDAEGFRVSTVIRADSAAEPYDFRCESLINCAGLGAQGLAASIAGLAEEHVPPLYLCKGDYFSYRGKSPFSHLVYPLPVPGQAWLGLHATLDLAGQLRFGPDNDYVEHLDYRVDPHKAERFASQARVYFPGLSADDLVPAYAGIRPKLVPAGAASADFLIQTDNGMDGLIQLFGLESPGLTASLAIAERVRALLAG